MGFTIQDYVRIFLFMLLLLLLIQFTYSAAILVLERNMINAYQPSIINKPTNTFQKAWNIISIVSTGAGYYLYKRVAKFNWLLRKILFLIELIIQGLLSIMIYQVIKGILSRLLSFFIRMLKEK